jgi:hypothetical protein
MSDDITGASAITPTAETATGANVQLPINRMANARTKAWRRCIQQQSHNGDSVGSPSSRTAKFASRPDQFPRWLCVVGALPLACPRVGLRPALIGARCRGRARGLLLHPYNAAARSVGRTCLRSTVAIISTAMGQRAAQMSSRSGRSWRSLIAVAVGYSFLIQSFLVGLAGAHGVATVTDNRMPGFELCLSSGHGAPLTPDKSADRDVAEHCTLCLSGTDVSLAQRPQSPFQYIGFEAGRVWYVADNWREPQSARFSVARPRGPPPSA